MSPQSLSQLVADAWEYRLRISEDPFTRLDSPLLQLLGLPRRSYRNNLDRVRINGYGEKIPRIAIVRDNIAQLYGYGPRKTPRLPA